MPRKDDSAANDSQQARPPLERMLHIHQALQSGSFPTANRLALELEVATKTIRRDIVFMRDRMKLPIEFNQVRNGFFYNGEVGAFPTFQITEGELFALIVAEKAIQQYRGTNFEKPLLSALKKLEGLLPDTISLNMAELEQSISFRTRAEPILNLKIFNTLAEVTTQRERVKLLYKKPGAKEAELRVIDPYHLSNINGEWFLFAFDHGRNDIRTFVPARVQEVQRTGINFPRPEKFSLEKRLRGSFGVHSAQGEFKVVLRFSPRVADFIREKKWHDSQELKELKDGGVELSLTLTSLVEIERWVLGWGGDAKVIKPPELIERIHAAAKKLLDS